MRRMLLVVSAAVASGILPPGTASAQVPSDACLSLTTFELLPATVVGTDGNDVIRGTEGPDVIVGGGGNDGIWGLGGYDAICGGLGNDQVDGGTRGRLAPRRHRRELPAR